MKLIKINPKQFNFNPKRLFQSKKGRSDVSRPEPPSFGSATSSSSSLGSFSSALKPSRPSCATDNGTPRSVLPITSAFWSDTSSYTTSDLVQAFKLIDRDNDGIVSRKELEALLSRVGAEPPSEEEVTTMLSEVDRDGDGCINLETLMSRIGSACGPASDLESELHEAFDFFDADHDGKITAEELLSVFAMIGDERCTLEDCQRMIAGVDMNGDGFVCFEDFVRMMELQK